jgi:VanZ family protein
MTRNRHHNSSLRTVLINQGPLLAYAALIFIVSSMSRLAPPDIGITFFDKIIHCGEYGLFFLLAMRAVSGAPVDVSRRSAYIWAIALTVIYGALDEYHQSFVPGRDADVYDLVADTCGALLAATGFYIIHRRKKRRDNATIRQDVADGQK